MKRLDTYAFVGAVAAFVYSLLWLLAHP